MAGVGFGSQHSQTLVNWVAATPGLKVVCPSDSQSAYSLIRAAIQDPDPVMVLEPRALYAERGEVDTGVKIAIELHEPYDGAVTSLSSHLVRWSIYVAAPLKHLGSMLS